MTDAPHVGEARLAFGGREFTLVYDWRAFSALGKAGFTGLDALTPYEPERLAEILAIGLRRHHPEMTAEAVFAASPPFVPVIEAVARAIGYALAGPGTDREPDPPRPAAPSPAGRT